MEKKKVLAGLVNRMKTDKRFEITVYAVLVGLIIFLYAASTLDKNDAKSAEQATSLPVENAVYDAERQLEQRLADILSNIRGAGNVEVMITYETGTEIVPAMSVDTQNSSSEGGNSTTINETQSSKPATVSQGGQNQPIVLTEIQPTIRGVIVIAEGAANISVSVDLQRAVQTVLGVPANCIEVFEMTSKKEEP